MAGQEEIEMSSHAIARGAGRIRTGHARLRHGPLPGGPALFDRAAPERMDLPRHGDEPAAGTKRADGSAPHDALLALDIETVVDAELLPPDWPADRFPKPAWHRVVAISFVEASIHRNGCDGTEEYRIRSCRSGGDAGWCEERLLRAFWKYFEGGRFRVVTWNGRGFDIPTLLMRSMRHGIGTPAWFRRGTKWSGYGYRYALDWHADVMEAMADFGSSSKLTLDEGAALIGMPGKLGEHGSNVAAMVEAGEIGRVRAYCETDTLNLVALYFRWCFLTGRINAKAHDRAVSDLMSYLRREGSERPHLARFLDAWTVSSEHRCAFVGSEARQLGMAGAMRDVPLKAVGTTH